MSRTNAPPPRPSAPPPQPFERVAVVVNGNARGVTRDLVQVLDQIVQRGDLFVSRSLDEAQDIARIIVERGYPTVVTGGGDGTFTQMVTWVTREARRRGKEPPRFGVLRLGTGNAIAWVMGARDKGRRGRGVVADLARLQKEGGSRLIRLLDVDGVLTPFAGIGGDAAALQDYERVKQRLESTPLPRALKSGLPVYAVSIAAITSPRYLVKPRDRARIVNVGEPAFRLGVDGQPVGRPVPAGGVLYEGPFQMITMSTIPYWGFGARIFPFAEDRPDRYHLRVVNISPIDVALHLKSIWNGSYRDDRVYDFLADRVRIECEGPVPLHLGGDPAGARERVEVALSEEPVRIVDFYGPPPVAEVSSPVTADDAGVADGDQR